MGRLRNLFPKRRKSLDKLIHQKKNRGHRTSKIVKPRQSYSNGHLPFHCSCYYSARALDAWRGVYICVSSKDAQKQLSRSSLIYFDCVMYWYATTSILANENAVLPEKKKKKKNWFHRYLPVVAISQTSIFLCPQGGQRWGEVRLNFTIPDSLLLLFALQSAVHVSTSRLDSTSSRAPSLTKTGRERAAEIEPTSRPASCAKWFASAFRFKTTKSLRTHVKAIAFFWELWHLQ